MIGSGHPVGGSAADVVREIDEELERLHSYEKLVAAERKLLLSARAALTAGDGVRPGDRPRVFKGEVAAYLAEHPGSSPSEIAEALHVPETKVSNHLYRGRRMRYERREDGWRLRAGVRSEE